MQAIARGIDRLEHRIGRAARVHALGEAEQHDFRKGQHARHAHRRHVQGQMLLQPLGRDRGAAVRAVLLREQGEPAYIEEVTEEPDEDGMAPGMLGGNTDAESSLYDQAVALVTREGKASTSFVQRHLNIGYNRAAKLIEQMEKAGVVGAANHVGKREVLAPGPRD